MPNVMSPASMSSVNTPPMVSLNSPTPHQTNRVPSAGSPNPSANGVNGVNGTAGSGGNGGMGLLIPTDRSQEELEEKWLPRLGRLKVEREVVLQGYALYALRTRYLSRTHWTQTIVTQTGKPNEHVSTYLIVPDPELSESAGKAELNQAIRFLVDETHAQQRKTEHGILLVTTPSAFGQDVFPIPAGDLREQKPFLIVNTGLRRLGCGGRAAMGMESPIPAVRRKFFELYKLPAPSSTPLSRTTSPTNSPTKADPTSPINPISPSAINSDPFTHMLLELVRLIQACLTMWGMVSEELEIDGLFCDETKKGVFAWRKAMGMEHEEGMRMEKETSGGCIDPKTLGALLSSVTSTRYQLDALAVEKVPKDPFSSPRRFLNAWQAYHVAIRQDRSAERTDFLTVSSIRHLNTHYLNERTRSPDALKVHRFLLSGVASATSSLHANLKGGSQEDTPLRKREHHLRGRLEDSTDSGLGLVVPAGEVGVYAPPDVMTSDLEAYTKGILKSREKDWDVMGARRIASLWSGQTDLIHRKSYGHSHAPGHRHGRLHGSVLRRRVDSVDDAGDGEHGARGAFGKMTSVTGNAIRGGLGLVSRRGTTYETSDSETGGPGPSSLKNALTRRKQSTVPTVIEPDVEEVDEHLGHEFTPSPSPAASRLHVDRPFGTTHSRHSYLSATSRDRPSIITALSHDGSDGQSRRSYQPQSPDERSEEHHGRLAPGDRAVAWRNRGRATAMLRTSSDGADVVLEEGGMEWEVVNPHGTAKGRVEDHRPVVRRHSLQDRLAYRSMRISTAEHLATDVELCSVLLEFRSREAQLAQKAAETKKLEESIFKATQDLIDAIRSRRHHLSKLEGEAEQVQKDLRRVVEEVDDDEKIQWANKKIQFYLSEDSHQNEILWGLRALEKEWEEMKGKVGEEQEGKGRWWWFW